MNHHQLLIIHESKAEIVKTFKLEGWNSFLEKGAPAKELRDVLVKAIPKMNLDDFKHIFKSITGIEYGFDTLILFVDAYIQYNGKKYTIKDLFNINLLILDETESYKSLNILKATDQYMVITGTPFEIILFNTKIQQSNKIPVYNSPFIYGVMRNNLLELDASGKPDEIYYNVVSLIFKGDIEDAYSKPTLNSIQTIVRNTPSVLLSPFVFDKLFMEHKTNLFGQTGSEDKIKKLFETNPLLNNLTYDNYVDQLNAFVNDSNVQKEIYDIVHIPISWKNPDLPSSEKDAINKRVVQNIKDYLVQKPFSM